MPESLFTLDSSDDEVYTDSLTSHTTASDSATNNLTSFLEPSLLPRAISKTESQFSSSMSYLEGSTPTTPTIPSIDSVKPSSTTASNRLMIVSLHQTLILKPNMRHPLLSPLCPFLEEALEAPKENPMKDMETSMPLTL